MKSTLLLLPLLALAVVGFPEPQEPEPEPMAEAEPEPEYEPMAEAEPEPEYEPMPAYAPEYEPMEGGVLQAILEAEPDSIYIRLMRAAGLVHLLDMPGPLTVFAPSNYAFAMLEPEVLLEAQVMPMLLRRLLKNHMIRGKIMAADLSTGPVKTMGKSRVFIDVEEDGEVTLNDLAKVTQADIEAGNGIVHLIDGVLEPIRRGDMKSSEEEDYMSEDEKDIFGHDVMMVPIPAIAINFFVVEGLKGMGVSEEMLETLGINALLEMNPPMMRVLMVMDAMLKAFGGMAPSMKVIPAPMPEPGVRPMGMPPMGMPPMGMPKSEMGPMEILLMGMSKTEMGEKDMPAFKMLNSTMGAMETLLMAMVPMGTPIPRLGQEDIPPTGKPPMGMPPMGPHGMPPMMNPMMPYNDNDLMAVGMKENLHALMHHVHMAAMQPLLSTKGPYTILAPSNEASEELINPLRPTFGTVRDVITSHFLPATLMAADITDGLVVPTLQGGQVRFSVAEDGSVSVNNGSARVVRTDIMADNGVIHVIDAVLPPATYVEQTDNILEVAKKRHLNMFLDFLNTAGLDELLSGEGPFTVFAPTDAAFMKLSTSTLNDLKASPDLARSMLAYHVAPRVVRSSAFQEGQQINTLADTPLSVCVREPEDDFSMVSVDAASICSTDIEASNGVLHLVESVLAPPIGTLAAVISEDPELSTLWTALQLAGMADVLAEDAPLTVFAPTDAAFARLPPGVLDELLADSEALGAVLRTHVVPGRAFSVGLMGGQLTSLEDELTVMRDPLGRMMVAGGEEMAPVMTKDVVATNGVVHKLGNVIA